MSGSESSDSLDGGARSPCARVEFLGVPGAGKSSLVSEVIDELQGIGLNEAVYAALRAEMGDRLFGPVVRHMPRRVGRRVYKHLAARSQDRLLALRGFLLHHPKTAIAILDALDDRRDIDPRQDLALGWIVELLWQYEIVSGHQESFQPLVLDEGFCNRAVTLFGYHFSERDEARLRRYIANIPKPDLVIVVTGDPEAMAARVTGRARFSHLSDIEAIEYTRDAAACVTFTARLLSERGVAVRTVRNDSSLAAAAREVRRTVREWHDGK